VTKARARLGFQANSSFTNGLAELTQWVARQTATDMVEDARRELERRGLVA
jgi:dTDP-L-rhamnose 4-epimerase